MGGGGFQIIERTAVGVLSVHLHEDLKALQPLVELNAGHSGNIVLAKAGVPHVVRMIGQQEVFPPIVQGVAVQVIDPLGTVGRSDNLAMQQECGAR